nr:DUF6461 domain-containing protein [Streptomyces sp. DSM 41633]
MTVGLQWISDGRFDHYCLTLAKGVQVAELVRRMGGDPSRITEPVTLSEAGQIDGGYGLVALVGSADGWAFALEPWSLEGDDEDIVESVSAGTEAVVVTNSSSGPSMFRMFRDGRALVRFEVTDLDADTVTGELPGLLVPAMTRVGILGEDGLSAHPEDAARCVLRLVEEEFRVSVPQIGYDGGQLAAVNLEPEGFSDDE